MALGVSQVSAALIHEQGCRGPRGCLAHIHASLLRSPGSSAGGQASWCSATPVTRCKGGTGLGTGTPGTALGGPPQPLTFVRGMLSEVPLGASTPARCVPPRSPGQRGARTSRDQVRGCGLQRPPLGSSLKTMPSVSSWCRPQDLALLMSVLAALHWLWKRAHDE